MYLFSSPSVPLLIEQVLNVYLLQLYISLEERFCDEVLLPLLGSVMF